MAIHSIKLKHLLLLGSTILTVPCSGQITGKVINAKNVVNGNGNKFYNNTTKKTVIINHNSYYYNILSPADIEALSNKVPPDNLKKEKTIAKSSVLIVPKIKNNEDIYVKLADDDIRTGLEKVTQIFSENGFEIISFPDKNTVTRLKLPDKSTGNNAQAVYLSGADICIQLETIKHTEGDEVSVSVYLSAFDRNDGSLLAQASERSNSFRTTDYSLLIESVIPDVSNSLIEKLKKKG